MRSTSQKARYVMRADSSALTLRLVWQSSLTTLPFGGIFILEALNRSNKIVSFTD